MPQDSETAAHRQVIDEHGVVVDGIAESADRVAGAWKTPPTDRAGVVEPFTAVLSDAGLLERLPDLLAGAVDAAGYDLSASPVAAPPYVTVASTGPVCRATVPDGRLVVQFEHFSVERGGRDDGRERGVRYVRRDCDPVEAVSVELRD